MKHIFEPNDIKPGMYVRKNGYTFIISWDSHHCEGILGQSDRIIYLTQVDTDGMMMRIGTKFEEAAKFLTDRGYLSIDNPFSPFKKK